MKARNKIDNRIYAVKKVRLRATQSDSKIFREVNALSRLNHRFIVRYYTTWVETSDPASTAASSDSEREGDHTGSTSVPHSDSNEDDQDPFTIDMSDLGSDSRHSFPSIHFTRSASANADETDLDASDASDNESNEDGFSGLFVRRDRVAKLSTPPTPVTRTLYIQMVCSGSFSTYC